MTLHFPDEVATNLLTIDATDPKSGTAEFKATAIRVEQAARRTADGTESTLRDAIADGPGTRLSAVAATRGRDATARRSPHGPRPAHLAPARRCTPPRPRLGWVSAGALNYICRRLDVPPAEAVGRRLLLPSALARGRARRVVAHVCDDIACRIRGGEALCAALEHTLGPAGAARDGSNASWMRSPCLGLCERAPAVLVTVAGEAPRTSTLAPVEGGVEEILAVLRRSAGDRGRRGSVA